jgi:16S rRNA (cytosine1402-N4)-methyltransferase
MQLDDGYRGFSFSKEAPLDMRMSMKGISAKDIVNTYSETELANILFTYGEETKSRQIAKRVIEYRTNKEIETTTELAEIIYTVLPKRFGKIDPATKSFQALRIAVNDELEQLKEGLIGGANLLLSGGSIVVVDFHSLEDRIVKLFFRENSAPKEHVSRYKESSPALHSNDKLFCFASKALLASEEEIKINPRARSAKLRYAIKREEQNYE